MDEIERSRAEAEALRQERELERQAAEQARRVAEESRAVAESQRRAVAGDVEETIKTLTTLLNRMEAVEELRRNLRNGMS